MSHRDFPPRTDLLVVGGGPSGLSAARAYRAAGGMGSVTIVGDEDEPPYRRPPLTKEFLREPFPVRDLYIEQESFFDQNSIDLQIRRRVVEIDTGVRTATTADGRRIEYRDVILATGSEPSRPPVPGGDDPNVRVMRRVGDASSIAERSSVVERVVVLGSGFIGCEAAASVAMRGNEVILVSMEEVPQLSRLGEQAGGYIADWLRGYGVELHLGEAIEEIEATPEGSVLRLASGTRLEAQMVILGTGVMPATGLAEAAHLPMESGRITVDDSMRTKVPGVWAVGDVAFALNRSAGRHLSVEHWGEALVQGEIAGRALAGEDVGWDSVPGFWSTIGEKTVKYRAWGDGFDDCRFQQTTGGFTVRYGRSGRLVGVLTHNCDDAYEESSPQIIDGEEL